MSNTRLTPEQWATIRGEREAGSTFGELARRHGVSKTAIVKRSTAEGWGDGQEGRAEITRLARARAEVTGNATATEAKNALVDSQADKAAAVLRQHQTEWRIVDTLRAEAMRDRHTDPDAAFTRAKLAKITAETIAIRQAGERKAYGLDRDANEQTVVIDRGSQVMVYLPSNGR